MVKLDVYKTILSALYNQQPVSSSEPSREPDTRRGGLAYRLGKMQACTLRTEQYQQSIPQNVGCRGHEQVFVVVVKVIILIDTFCDEEFPIFTLAGEFRPHLNT